MCFFPDDIQYETNKRIAQDLLEEYRYFNKNFSFHFVDPESQPALARQHQIRQYGTIVFISGTRQKAVTLPTEQNFTNALLEVSGAQAKKIYFLTGNGEHDINSKDQDGYSEARMGLIRDLYQVQALNLTLNNEIPPDCAVLIMAGTKKLLPPEVTRGIRTFLKKHGKLLMLVDPNPPEEVKEILSDWGLTVKEGRVMDPGAYVAPDRNVPAVFKGQYPPVVITTGLDTTYFPDAVAFDLTKETGNNFGNPDERRRGQSRMAFAGGPVSGPGYTPGHPDYSGKLDGKWGKEIPGTGKGSKSSGPGSHDHRRRAHC